MGKVRKITPKKDDKQKKISSFFQNGANGPKKAQRSLAFSSIGNSGTSRTTDLTQTKSLNQIHPPGSKQENAIVIPETQLPSRGAPEAPTCIPETQVPPQAKKHSVLETPKNKALTPSEDEDDPDSCIIPDTPEDSAALEKRKRPLKSSRSFLCSSSFIAKSHVGPGTFGGSKPKVSKQKVQTGRSLEEALKDPTITGGTTGWNATDPNFNVLMSEMGVKLSETRDSAMGSVAMKTGITGFSAEKRTAAHGEGISPDSKRIDRRPSGAMGNVSKCRKKLEIGKGKESGEVNLKLSALKELKNNKKVKSPTSAETKAACDINDDDDDILCDILNELTNDGKKSNNTDKVDVEIKQFNTQYLPAYKKAKRQLGASDTVSKRNEISNGAMDNCEENIDSRMLLNDIIDELTQTAPKSAGKIASTQKPKRSIGPKIYDSQMDAVLLRDTLGSGNTDKKELEILEENFKSLSPFKQQQEASKEEMPLPPASTFNRYTVSSVERTRDAINLTLKPVFGDNTERSCSLHSFWADTAVGEGDVVHVTGEFDPSTNHCTISTNKGLIVVNPDLLISGTTVVSTVQCMRRSVLNEKFKGYDAKNIYMLYGSIIHEFFQRVIQEKALTTAAMTRIAENIVKDVKYIHDMYELGVDEHAVLEEIGKYIPQVISWSTKYLSASQSNQPKQNGDIEISGIADIEENIWCPRYGIKGKIDLTVEVKIHENSRCSRKKMMPLELKTGRPTFSVEHKGQVTLYSMMSGDRRDDPGAGLLLYLRDASMKTIPADHVNKRGLIQLRNEFAHYLNRSIECHVKGDGNDNDTSTGNDGGLPEPINNHRQCSKCPHLLNCALYQSTIERRETAANSVMATLVPETTGHLADAHLEYYRRWLHLMHLEMNSGNSRSAATRDIWCKTALQREASGQCISSMVLSGSPTKLDNGAIINKFVRQKNQRFGLVNTVGLSRGDFVIISSENKPLIALTQGTVQSIGENDVSLALDRNLYEGNKHMDTVFRIDKYEGMSTFGINFTNLAKLMENKPNSLKIRNIIIDKKRPEFEKTLSKGKIESVKSIFKTLNKPQKAAVLRVLLSKDYVLIKGYPGTGKTSTIVSLVRILTALRQSVLLCGYTHSAVDNILLKLSKSSTDFVRLGRLERIHPEIQGYSAEKLTKKITTVKELEAFYQSKPVVATTCLGVAHPVFTRRTFDVCIVDEASQVLQPACLGPLYCAGKFVLVGDPKQLPPVVQSKAARDLGMSESLFARLDDTGATFELNVQYRMNRAIMKLSNELVYDGALECGAASVASGTLQLPNKQHLQGVPAWIQRALSSEPGDEVVFLDTKMVLKEHSGEESRSVHSETEAEIVLNLVRNLSESGLGSDNLGVISPYREQVRLIKHLLLENHLSQVEVNTVDQYQGRDKQVIIVSFVKSTVAQGGHASDILKDIRRLNVAITRAKVKLILVGHAATLVTYEPIQKLLPLMQQVIIPQNSL